MERLTDDEARKQLAELLQLDSEHWNADTAECDRCASALIEWFNLSSLTRSDLKLLKRVALAGFRFWNCPTCGELVCEGESAVDEIDPKWARFQGVQENDRCSYPGHGYHDMRCNRCRCFNVGGTRLPDRCEC